ERNLDRHAFARPLLLLPGVGGNSGGLPFSNSTCTPSGFVIVAVQPGRSQPSANATASAIRENSPLALPEPPGAVLRQLTFQGPFPLASSPSGVAGPTINGPPESRVKPCGPGLPGYSTAGTRTRS